MSKRIVEDRQRKQIKALEEKLAQAEEEREVFRTGAIEDRDEVHRFGVILDEVNALFPTPAETVEGIPAVVRAFVAEALHDRERLRELQVRLLGPAPAATETLSAPESPTEAPVA